MSTSTTPASAATWISLTVTLLISLIIWVTEIYVHLLDINKDRIVSTLPAQFLVNIDFQIKEKLLAYQLPSIIRLSF